MKIVLEHPNNEGGYFEVDDLIIYSSYVLKYNGDLYVYSREDYRGRPIYTWHTEPVTLDERSRSS
jgi:hypothetical protein